MPTIQLNFPKVQLIDYITESVLDEHHPHTLLFRYNKPDIVQARSLAIQRAISERKRLRKLQDWESEPIEHIRICLEYAEYNPDKNMPVTLHQHYVFVGIAAEWYDPLIALDYEGTLWSAYQPVPTVEVKNKGLTYTVIAQCHDELLGLIDDVGMNHRLNGEKNAVERTCPLLAGPTQLRIFRSLYGF